MLHVSTKVEQGTVVLQISERFDFHVMDRFLSALQDAEVTHLPHHVILDLSQVTFMDSMAIGRIVTMCQRLTEASIRVTLAGQQGGVDITLKAIKLEDIVPTVATALALLPQDSAPARNHDA